MSNAVTKARNAIGNAIDALLPEPNHEARYDDRHEMSARLGKPFGSLETETIESTILFFLNQYQYVYEKRLQKLVFYADYRYYQEHGEKLTTARYEPYIYGMYSYDIQNLLKSMNLPTRRVIVNGNKTIKYLPVSNDEFPGVDEGFLQQIHEETRDVKTADLAKFSKNIPMFEATEYQEVAVFNDETVEDPDTPPKGTY